MAALLATQGFKASKGRYNIQATDCELFLFEDWQTAGTWTLDGAASRPDVLARDATLL